MGPAEAASTPEEDPPLEEQRTILVVDDEPEVSTVLESALAHREYRIRSVRKWTEAIAEIHETPPDIVLLDLYLPTVQGEALLEFIKDLNLNLPVVIVSSEIDPGKMAQLGQLGARISSSRHRRKHPRSWIPSSSLNRSRLQQFLLAPESSSWSECSHRSRPAPSAGDDHRHAPGTPGPETSSLPFWDVS